jgi:KipI family sensor histidine kinase inhibitor
MTPTILPAGERAVLAELPDAAAARALAAALRAVADDRVEEVVPGARTVLVVAREPTALAGVRELLVQLPAVVEAGASDHELVIPVRYDGADLEAVAGEAGLTVEEVVARHTGARYVVEFVGFAPGFGYLSGLDPALQLPRLANPRPSVPAGSVAIAGAYSAVYPRSSPGGWRLLGRTDVVLFDVDAEPPSALAAGTVVRFVSR